MTQSRAAGLIRIASLALSCASVASCGYGPARDVLPAGPFCVRGAAVVVADPSAVAAMEAGARAALARAGRLGDCTRDPTLTMQLVELTSSPEAIVGSGQGLQGRAERFVAVVSAVLSGPGDTESGALEPVRISATQAYAAGAALQQDASASGRAQVAWLAGKRMAERAIGVPTPSDPRPIMLDGR